MKKLLFVCSLLVAMCVQAQETVRNAIYTWVDGESKCYRLSDMPKVSYEGSFAVLTINGKEQLRLDLGEKELKITYGEYLTTNVEKTTTPVQQVGKYIRGGQLIIVRDGVQYDIHGRVVNTVE